MRNFISDKVESILPSGIRKFFDIVSEMKDAISLGVGEPDFDTPWHIREEGIFSLRCRTRKTSDLHKGKPFQPPLLFPGRLLFCRHSAP